MAYRGNGTASNNGNGNGTSSAGFSLPSVTSRSTAGSSAVGGSSISSGSASSLLSAFNSSAAVGQGARGSSGGSLGGFGAPTSSAGAVGSATAAAAPSATGTSGTIGSGLPNTAQAAFLNAGPNRTVSNVGQQAAQTGPAQGAYGSRELLEYRVTERSMRIRLLKSFSRLHVHWHITVTCYLIL